MNLTSESAIGIDTGTPKLAGIRIHALIDVVAAPSRQIRIPIITRVARAYRSVGGAVTTHNPLQQRGIKLPFKHERRVEVRQDASGKREVM